MTGPQVTRWIFAVVGVIAIVVVLAGCETTGDALEGVDSVQSAGITAIDVEPLEIAGQVATKYRIRLGKEYDSFSVTLTWDEQGRPKVQADASNVRAVESQRVAAEATAEIQRALSAAGVENVEALTGTIRDALGAWLKGR